MLKNRGRDSRLVQGAAGSHPAQLVARPPGSIPGRTIGLGHRTLPPPTRAEPDYEVVEFPTDQYVNAKLQPPPPPPPRPTAGHPVEAGASCGLCGGGGARVRCAECGRRALCASCDDMYHRHPKRRHHQRQALSASQIRDDRPPLPPKAAAPVPPPRRHKISGDRLSASPRPAVPDQRRATLAHLTGVGHPSQTSNPSLNSHLAAQHVMHQPVGRVQAKLSPAHIGSMPYLPTSGVHGPVPIAHPHLQSNTLSHMNNAWAQPRGSLQGYNMSPSPNMAAPSEVWNPGQNFAPASQGWTRPLRRGASVLELGGGGGGGTCAGCAHCAPGWRYGSCASLDHAWPQVWPQPACCSPHPIHPHAHQHPSHTPQPYRRADSRAVSRAGSRGGSRAASPAMSVRSRASRRPKHRTPSPPPLPSSDADSESESESDHAPANIYQNNEDEESLGPPPPPPSSTWQCEHCTFVNEPGIRVCSVCCRTPTVTPKVVNKLKTDMERLKITEKHSTTPTRTVENQRPEISGQRSSMRTKKERSSIACGPPREEKPSRKPTNRLVTPTREQSVTNMAEAVRNHHDMAVGPSPPREVQSHKADVSPASETSKTMKVSPYREAHATDLKIVKRHTVSVGPSPPRESSIAQRSIETTTNNSKKSTGTSPPRETLLENRSSSTTATTKVSNTGTSPPPQSISTQTYEVPNSWERAPSASQTRSRRRFRDEARRERSHSRHSLSSDTRESERSARTSGAGGRWEWRERDSSPGGEGSEGYSRLSRRASHLDLRRTRSNRRTSFYGSEAASPEPHSTTRAVSLEALAGVGARRETERGLELARLMSEAERLGFSAAEVQAALAQSPAAPLAWLRARWPSLVAGVRAAAVRLAPAATISEMDARAALARHRGAMWPAVTDCVEKHRLKTEAMNLGEERRLRGHVWGPPAGVDDEAVPPETYSHRSHRTREESSDEFEAFSPTKLQDDQWMYLPLDMDHKIMYAAQPEFDVWDNASVTNELVENNNDMIAQHLKNMFDQAESPSIDNNLIGEKLSSVSRLLNNEENISSSIKIPSLDLIQSENDFIDAYNALTKTSPLPNISESLKKDKQPNGNASNAIQEIQTLNENESKTFSEENFTTESLANKKDTKVKENVSEYNNPKLINNIQPTNVRRRKTKVANNSDSEEDTRPTRRNSNRSKLKKSQTNSESEAESKNPSPTHFDGKTVEIYAENVNGLKSEEKSNNLNDIVDNTQKLIQQMKEEINSDINSIDGRNISDSEPDSSSNTEQESSYSDQDGTENLTSDEKETSSSDDEDSPVPQNELNIQRTSSEDNEQFEEALDHIDNQIENFRHANIEILDSIAKSLQKEHTISIQKIDTKTATNQKQDLNNNLFVAVNSFEEIYEELSVKDPIKEEKSSTQSSKSQSHGNNITEEPLQHITVLEKHDIKYSFYKMNAPIQVIHVENKHPIFKATLKNIDEHPASKTDNMLTNTTSLTTTVAIEHNAEVMENTPLLQSVELESDTVILRTSRSVSPEEKTSQHIMQNKNLQQSEINNDQTNVSLADGNIQQLEITHSVELVPPSELENNEKEDDPENVHPNQCQKNQKTNSVRSNIPKLIKLAQNAKAKLDNKNSPKFIVSKVPVRKTSLKQYPAPAPPKTHFGTIQNGHVKQLQSRLFSNKPANPPIIKESELLEIKPSTSTLHKKKLAPLPPVPQIQKQSSPPKLQQPERKTNYFRETCRTEDEWTDSDSEDSQLQIVKSKEEPINTPPSPPPPITVRRVSGQLIDLAKVQLPEGSPERQARMLLAEGAAETWEQAQLAVDLIARGVESPAALLAALECADLTSALTYLHQDCELCASRLPEHEMVSMLRCTHRCCRECARLYFNVQITERSIADCVCPYCKVPELESLPEDAWLEYFAHLDILLKTLLEADVHELFQRKLRDRTLARDPNFRWCMECSSGFFVHPKHKKIRCPECKSVSCASCRKPWTSNHEGLTCDQYNVWLEDNDPERSAAAVQQHLRENGLECPRCHFKYSLSRGGCMHFTCTQCKYEFCYGCGKPFTMGARCGLSEYCARLGLHAHHPRNCLFYLRDKEPHELQTLLQMNNVTYETEAAESSTGRCPVQLQRETPTGLVDGTCGSEAPANFAGLCKNHYVEYLAGLARGLDPIPIMDVTELVAELRRRALPLPERGPWDTDPLYAGMCAEIVREKIPLD